ncbi:MAG: RnfABCDGE type electron transport complex subunit G [Candidatus Eremiobacteraeota bacterium]|nr:RnfABCDGE type electron transport complex subunit G [Candidatus Eremiobacteraeota bacterium]
MNFKEVFKTTLNLVIICLCVGAMLALANQLTAGKIKENERKETKENRKVLIPTADKFVDMFKDDKYKLSDNSIKALEKGNVSALVEGLDKQGKSVGYVVESSKDGYSSKIKVMYSISPAPNFKVMGMLIKDSAETPGLGENIKKPNFKNQFKDKPLDDIVLGDPPKIKALTGATISSRAVTGAVHDSLKNLINTLKNRKSENKGAKKKTEYKVERKTSCDFSLFGSKAYAKVVKVDPELKKLLQADKYVKVIPGAYKAVRKGKFVGYVAKGFARGYNDTIMVGYATDTRLRVLKVRILRQNESPGYREQIGKADFLNQFKGKTLKTLVLKMSENKSNKYISAISGATVSSKAAVMAVRNSLKRLETVLKK